MNGTRTNQPHGSNTRYRNGCRCAPCRTAANKHQRAARRAAPGLPPGDTRHGTVNGYDHWGCHCGPCTAAKGAFRSPRQPIRAGLVLLAAAGIGSWADARRAARDDRGPR